MAVLIGHARAILRWWTWGAYIAAVLLAFALPSRSASREDTEYQLKAAFLLNFARFVEWPADAFESPNAPLVIGIIGQDPFGVVLDNLVAGKKVENHDIVVQRLRDSDAATRCHLLFISDSKRSDLSDILKRIDGRPVLTISDTDRFSESGGMIWLKRRQDMIRFDINLQAAEAAKLKISSRLFKLADNLRDKH
jgi:hypothetical protein